MNKQIDDIIKYGVYTNKQIVDGFTTNYLAMSYITSNYGLNNLFFYAYNLGLSWPGWSDVSAGTVSAQGCTHQYLPSITPSFVEGAFCCASYRRAGGGALPGLLGDNYTYVRLFATGPQSNDGVEISFDWNRRTMGVAVRGAGIASKQPLPSLPVPGTVRYRIVGNSLYIATEWGDTTGIPSSAAGTNWVHVGDNLNLTTLPGRYINVYYLGYRYSNQAQSLDMNISSFVLSTYR